MSASNTETETETETGSPDQQPECEFDFGDLDIRIMYSVMHDLAEWECSRPVWEEASEKRCVWHACDGQTQQKPNAELEKTVDDGDLHGSAAAGDLSGIDFPVETGFIDADLSEAHLTNADLSGANLYDANLSEANLYNANLSVASPPMPTSPTLTSKEPLFTVWGSIRQLLRESTLTREQQRTHLSVGIESG
jgi:hypothetical protein